VSRRRRRSCRAGASSCGDEWEEKLKAECAKTHDRLEAQTCVTDLMDHFVSECDRLFAGTPYADSYVIYHDALKQWWEKEPQEHLLEKHGIGPERQMCIKGGTNDEVAGHYVNKLVGDSPELMPLDSNLFSYYENAMKLNIAHTDILPHDHEEKFLIGTPADVQKTMLRTWELVPTSAQIVQDIMRFPIALDAIIAAKGAKVDWLDNRKGRRASRKRPAPHVPPSCPAAEEAQRAKFDRLDPMPR